MRDNFPISILVSAIVFVASAAIWTPAWFYWSDIADENNIMENAQAGCLLFGFLTLLIIIYQEQGKSFRILFFGVALLYMTFLLRELELHSVGAYDGLLLITNPPVRNYWVSALWILAAIIFICNIKKTWSAFLIWLKSVAGHLMLWAGLFYALADIYDKDLLDIDPTISVFLEEFLESNAAVLMLLSAAFTFTFRRRVLMHQSSKYDSV